MKIINIIYNFNKNQRTDFVLFMQSPFFKISEEVQNLYQIIASFLDQPPNSFHKDEIYQAFISEIHPLTQPQFNKLVWKFHKVIEQFLSHYEFDKNTWQQKRTLLKSYETISETNIYQEFHKTSIKYLKQSPLRDADYYLNTFLLQNDLYFHPITEKNESEAGILLKEAHQHLDRFYILANLRLSVEFLSRQKILGENYVISQLSDIILLAKKQNDPVFNIYLWIIALLQKGHRNNTFEQLKNTFIDHLPLFSRLEQAMIMQLLINHTNRQFNTGNTKYLFIQFELYQIAIQKKLLIENNNQITDTSFTNIIITSCLCKEFDFAYHFIQTHKKYLPEKNRINAINLGWAYIYFHSGEFQEAWQQLNKTKFTNTTYKIRARSLLLRCYYEQLPGIGKLDETLQYSLKSFRKFIYRLSSIADQTKTLYYNQIKVIHALTHFNLKLDNKTTFKKKWRQFLQEHPTIAKRWLLEKIKEL